MEVRFMMVLLKCGGQFSLLGLLKHVEHKLKSPEAVNTLIPDARIKLLSGIQLFKTLLPFLVLAGKTRRSDEFAGERTVPPCCLRFCCQLLEQRISIKQAKPITVV
ncbi:unnamed protein product [Timema podura]|uniref:Uncharacterized protein n=1 Tax=Timema podura TaxID=61482 RepID=A0ABN7NWS9_TIMPD|nr:unnamed protein product [Timema podura]